MQAHRRRVVGIAQRSLIAGSAEHDRAIANAQFRVADAAVGHGQAHDLDGAEGFFVEVDGFGRFLNAQIGGDAVITLWNRFDAHDESPCFCCEKEVLCR
ncbi:hypothetical protein D3C80_1730730 [compost metagenome]